METSPDITFQNAKEKETQSATINKFIEMLKTHPAYLGTSASCWITYMFFRCEKMRCIQVRNDLKISISGRRIPGYLWKRVKHHYKEIAMCIGTTDEITVLLSKLKVQPKVAYFINAWLIPFVRLHNLHLELEETLEVQGLPTSRPDYIIYTKNNQILGCVEIKRAKVVAQKALGQCRLHLLSLHTKANHPLFGIVTDGSTYILMTIDEKGIFHQEEDYEKKGSTHRAKRKFKTWDDFKEILTAINELLYNTLKEATKSVNLTGARTPTAQKNKTSIEQFSKPTPLMSKNKTSDPSQIESKSRRSRDRSFRTVRSVKEGTVQKVKQGMEDLTEHEQELSCRKSSNLKRNTARTRIPHTNAPQQQVATVCDAKTKRKMVLELLCHSLLLLKTQNSFTTGMTPKTQEKERELKDVLAQLEGVHNLRAWTCKKEVEIQGDFQTIINCGQTVVFITSSGRFSGNESVIELRICSPPRSGKRSPPKTICVNLREIRENLLHVISGKNK